MELKVIEAKSFLNKFLGLIFTKNHGPMLFKTRFGIHTFFMKRPIDILVLDNQGNIKYLKEKMKPFRLFLYNPKYFLVIETKAGFIRENDLALNDKIILTNH